MPIRTPVGISSLFPKLGGRPNIQNPRGGTISPPLGEGGPEFPPEEEPIIPPSGNRFFRPKGGVFLESAPRFTFLPISQKIVFGGLD